MSHTIDVSVRVRPSPAGTPSTVSVSASGAVSLPAGAEFRYASNVVCGSDQEVAFNTVAARMLAKLDQGHCCTLLAYGQTGSGKTHTMFGPPGCLTEASLAGLGPGVFPAAWGIMPRAVLGLLQSLPAGSRVHASAIEVYQELAYDLLNERAPLIVGTKGGNQLTGMEGAAVGTKTAAVGSTHPAGCRCRSCVAVKDAKAEEMRRKMAEKRGEAYFTGAGSDPFKMAKDAREREKADKAPPPAAKVTCH